LLQICILYLVLRALDTVEDDVSIPDEKKHPILKGFHTYSVTPGWTFDAKGKGRQILLEYNNIVDEINLMSPEYAVPLSR
jgi:farnesyl-diphosphate farnesyltransferase